MAGNLLFSLPYKWRKSQTENDIRTKNVDCLAIYSFALMIKHCTLWTDTSHTRTQRPMYTQSHERTRTCRQTGTLTHRCHCCCRCRCRRRLVLHCYLVYQYRVWFEFDRTIQNEIRKLTVTHFEYWIWFFFLSRFFFYFWKKNFRMEDTTWTESWTMSWTNTHSHRLEHAYIVIIKVNEYLRISTFTLWK